MPLRKWLYPFIIMMIISLLAFFGEKRTVLAHEEESQGSSNPVSLLVDTDMGLDDVRSLFALLGDPRMDIHGIITVEGSASLGKGMDNHALSMEFSLAVAVLLERET